MITPDPIIPSHAQECIRCAPSPSSTVDTRPRVWHRVRSLTEAVRMKILVVNPFGDMYPIRNNHWLYFHYMCTDGTPETVMHAEKQGYDAVFISCNLDIGL